MGNGYNKTGYTDVNKERILEVFTRKNRFKNEKIMGDFIEKNIKRFANEINPEGELLHLKREFSTGTSFYGKSSTRIDMRLIFDNGVYIIEFKNPFNTYVELRTGISQCMDYATRYPKATILLVSSLFSEIVFRLILQYKLDIGFVLVNKEHMAFMYDVPRFQNGQT